MSAQKPDPDASKGATETDSHDQTANVGLQEQLGHRGTGPGVNDAGTDFPEPGGSPEHTGEPNENDGTSKLQTPKRKTA